MSDISSPKCDTAVEEMLARREVHITSRLTLQRSIQYHRDKMAAELALLEQTVNLIASYDEALKKVYRP